MKSFEEFEENEIENTERREVLAALVKYSAAVGGASTVVLSASEAVAKSAASGTAHQPRIKNKDRIRLRRKIRKLRKNRTYWSHRA
ncbi:hypothetical protein [Ruegeria arenilitoris]|uniref:hypothetical protein n=1 Tax=Ruegeria arenilitoris TaxID=1173585 RepID=UPI00147B6F02|nr:hypothetical protein [Ruegeria arenilitoris]